METKKLSNVKTLKNWAADIHRLAKEKGWYDKPISDLEFHALVHGEIAEATEEVRAGTPPIYQCKSYRAHHEIREMLPTDEGWDKNIKPEGRAIELVDVIIRIIDWFEYKGWDIEQAISLKHDFNKTRPHRHGGKLY